MSRIFLQSYAAGKWLPPSGKITELKSAVTGKVIAEIGSAGPDFGAMTAARARGRRQGAARQTFHERARMLKALAQDLNERRDALYELSFDTGATKADRWIDIDGGIGTLFVYPSKGRRELPNDVAAARWRRWSSCRRAAPSSASTSLTPLQGVAVHINAFNFPVWGMLEKLAPTLLAGVPAIVKPASATACAGRGLRSA